MLLESLDCRLYFVREQGFYSLLAFSDTKVLSRGRYGLKSDDIQCYVSLVWQWDFNFLET